MFPHAVTEKEPRGNLTDGPSKRAGDEKCITEEAHAMGDDEEQPIFSRDLSGGEKLASAINDDFLLVL